MPVNSDDQNYATEYHRRVQVRRNALIAKWRAMGCTENKIQELIGRRIRSRRQMW